MTKQINNYMKHWHHIIPKHVGGTDNESNLVHLTIEEHAEAHRILFEKYGRWQDRVAWLSLAGIMKDEERIYEIVSNSNKGNPSGWKPTEEQRKENSKRLKEYYLNNPDSKKHLANKTKEFWNNLTEEEKDKRKKQFLEIRELGYKTASKGKTWTLSEESKKNVADAKSVNWLITFPNGKKEIIKNMNKFCREHNLDQGAMSNVAKGKKNHHKGHLCQKLGH